MKKNYFKLRFQQGISPNFGMVNIKEIKASVNEIDCKQILDYYFKILWKVTNGGL
jgi:hypothetical protein